MYSIISIVDFVLDLKYYLYLFGSYIFIDASVLKQIVQGYIHTPYMAAVSDWRTYI